MADATPDGERVHQSPAEGNPPAALVHRVRLRFKTLRIDEMLY